MRAIIQSAFEAIKGGFGFFSVKKEKQAETALMGEIKRLRKALDRADKAFKVLRNKRYDDDKRTRLYDKYVAQFYDILT